MKVTFASIETVKKNIKKYWTRYLQELDNKMGKYKLEAQRSQKRNS